MQLLLSQCTCPCIVNDPRKIELEGNIATWKSAEQCFGLGLQFYPYGIDCLVETGNGGVQYLQTATMMSCGEAIKNVLPESPNGHSRALSHQQIVGQQTLDDNLKKIYRASAVNEVCLQQRRVCPTFYTGRL